MRKVRHDEAPDAATAQLTVYSANEFHPISQIQIGIGEHDHCGHDGQTPASYCQADLINFNIASALRPSKRSLWRAAQKLRSGRAHDTWTSRPRLYARRSDGRGDNRSGRTTLNDCPYSLVRWQFERDSEVAKMQTVTREQWPIIPTRRNSATHAWCDSGYCRLDTSSTRTWFSVHTARNAKCLGAV
jgi:hypothetical protein